MAQQANDASMSILSTFSTLSIISTPSTFYNVYVGLPDDFHQSIYPSDRRTDGHDLVQRYEEWMTHLKTSKDENLYQATYRISQSNRFCLMLRKQPKHSR